MSNTIHLAKHTLSEDKSMQTRVVVPTCDAENVAREQLTWNPQQVTCPQCKPRSRFGEKMEVSSEAEKILRAEEPQQSLEQVPSQFEEEQPAQEREAMSTRTVDVEPKDSWRTHPEVREDRGDDNSPKGMRG